MQYQKEVVRARIFASALDEFEKYGYKGAKMHRIAKAAQVATGNLYRYFKSKNEIFDEIVRAAYSRISSFIEEASKLDGYRRGDIKLLAGYITDGIMKIHEEYGRELLIIADKSAGSKHENFLQVLCDMIFERIKHEMSFDIWDTDDILIRVLSLGFVEGIFVILRSVADKKRREELISRMLILYFDDIERRLCGDRVLVGDS
jgi:AcrR family transcriptional regulator